MEEAIRLGGYQTLPLGRDRHGRFYYRFPRDSRRVFVSQPVREGDGDGGGGGGGDTGSTAVSTLGVTGAAIGTGAERGSAESPPPPTSQSLVCAPPGGGGRPPLEEDLMVYENDGDVEALVAWLNESGQREGPLRAALLRAFPPSPPPPPEQTKEVEGDGKKSESSSAAVAMDVAREGEDASQADGTDGAGEEEENAETGAASGKGGGGRGARRGARRGGDVNDRGVLARPSRNQELPRMLAEGGVELRIAVNPPGANNNVLVPATEAVVEFDNDGEAAEVCDGPAGLCVCVVGACVFFFTCVQKVCVAGVSRQRR